MPKKILTIDIGKEFIKISEIIKNKKNNPQITNLIKIPTPTSSYDDGQLINRFYISEVIKQALQNNNIKTKKAILTISSSRIVTREITMPLIQENKLASIIKLNATDYFPVNINNYILAHTVIGKIQNGENQEQRVLVYAAPSNLVESYYDLAGEIGLTVESIDYSGNSMYQFAKSLKKSGTNLYVQLGSESTLLTIMTNDTLQLQRVIPNGMKNIIIAIKDHFGVDEEKAIEIFTTKQLINEEADADVYYQNEIQVSYNQIITGIKRVIDYFLSRSQEQTIEKIYLLGGGALSYDIERNFEKNFNIRTSILPSIPHIDCGIEINNKEILFYTANIGAIYSSLNLTPEDVVREKSNARQLIIFVYLVALAFIFSGVGILVPYVGKNDVSKQKLRIEEEIRNIQSIEDIVKTQEQLKEQLTNKQMILGLTRTTSEDLLDVLEEMEEKLPTNLYILSITSSNEVMNMSIVAKDKETVAKFIQQIKEFDYFDNVNVPGLTSSDSSTSTGYVTFTVNLKYKSKGE